MTHDHADHSAQSGHRATRNESLEFASRTRKNLERIEAAARAGEDVHVVTQLTVSLLGLIVFPWEQQFDQNIKTRKLEALAQQGWPTWNILQGSTETLGDLVYHLRNAVAHRRVHFSSDSPDPENVVIQFADAKSTNAQPYWQARIGANDLRAFCLKFVALVDDIIG